MNQLTLAQRSFVHISYETFEKETQTNQEKIIVVVKTKNSSSFFFYFAAKYKCENILVEIQKILLTQFWDAQFVCHSNHSNKCKQNVLFKFQMIWIMVSDMISRLILGLNLNIYINEWIRI